MFKLLKLCIKFFLFIIFMIIALVVVGNYQLIHSKSGLHVLEREEWGFSDFYVDTTDWNAFDFAKNPRISTKLFKNRFEALFSDTKESVQNWWGEMTSDPSRPELQKLKKEFDQNMTQLNKLVQDNKMSIEKYREKLIELKRKTEKKAKKIMAALKED